MKKPFCIYLFSLLFFFSANSQILPTDRQINWSVAGLRDTTTIGFARINLDDFNLNGDGITPNDEAFAAVLASVGTDGAILAFPQGNFLFNEPIFLEKNTVITGAGANNTSLTFDLGGAGHAINISGTSTNQTTDVITTGEKDDNTFEVEDPNLFQPGDWIRLQQIDTHLVTSSWAEGTVGQIMQIEDINNNKMFFKSTFRKTFSLEDLPTITKIEPIENVGISCLKIIRVDNTAPSQTSNIRFNFAANCWVSSVESSKCTFSHIEIRTSSNLKIEKSYLHDAFEFGGGGRAYGIMTHFTSNEILVENNIFKRLRHSMILQAGANGNVFTYNYSFDPFWSSFPSDAAGDMVLHGNYIFANLFEQNIGQNIVIDNSHGPNGPNNTFFRNRGELFGIFFSATNSPKQNFIGNEITNLNIPYSIVNYNIQGSDHFILSNNNKGTIDPPASDTLSIQSLFYSDTPDFLSPNEWASIGAPNPFNQGTIPAFVRIQDNDPFINTCGQIITNTKNAEIQKENIILFPNPCIDFVKIQSEKIIQKIVLYNFSGNQIYSQTINEQSAEINLSKFPAGFYTLITHLNNGMTQSVNRIIKTPTTTP